MVEFGRLKVRPRNHTVGNYFLFLFNFDVVFSPFYQDIQISGRAKSGQFSYKFQGFPPSLETIPPTFSFHFDEQNWPLWTYTLACGYFSCIFELSSGPNPERRRSSWGRPPVGRISRWPLSRADPGPGRRDSFLVYIFYFGVFEGCLIFCLITLGSKFCFLFPKWDLRRVLKSALPQQKYFVKNDPQGD